MWDLLSILSPDPSRAPRGTAAWGGPGVWGGVSPEQGPVLPILLEQPHGRRGWVLGSAPTSSPCSHLRRSSKGSGTWMTQPSTLLSGRSRINRSDQQSHCGLLKTKQSQLLFETCRGAVANLITRSAARHPGNLTVPIKRSAAAQSNYGETAGLLAGMCWGLSPGLGARQGLPGAVSPAEHPCLPLQGALACQ